MGSNKDVEDYATRDQLQQDISNALSPIKLGEAFKGATEKSKDIDVAIKSVLVNLMHTDETIHKTLNKHIEENNKNAVNALLRKFGTVLLTLFSAFVGAVATVIITKYFK